MSAGSAAHTEYQSFPLVIVALVGAVSAAQLHETVLDHMSLAWEIKTQNLKQFLLNTYHHFHTSIKSKTPKSDHNKSRTICSCVTLWKLLNLCVPLFPYM
jgi:hypothetical protein